MNIVADSMYIGVVNNQENGIRDEAAHKVPAYWSGDSGRLREVDNLVQTKPAARHSASLSNHSSQLCKVRYSIVQALIHSIPSACINIELGLWEIRLMASLERPFLSPLPTSGQKSQSWSPQEWCVCILYSHHVYVRM